MKSISYLKFFFLPELVECEEKYLFTQYFIENLLKWYSLMDKQYPHCYHVIMYIYIYTRFIRQ